MYPSISVPPPHCSFQCPLQHSQSQPPSRVHSTFMQLTSATIRKSRDETRLQTCPPQSEAFARPSVPVLEARLLLQLYGITVLTSVLKMEAKNFTETSITLAIATRCKNHKSDQHQERITMKSVIVLDCRLHVCSATAVGSMLQGRSISANNTRQCVVRRTELATSPGYVSIEDAKLDVPHLTANTFRHTLIPIFQ